MNDTAVVVFSEIMYRPPAGKDLEYLELHNRGLEPVDVGGWRLTQGVRYRFEAGTVLAPGGFLLLSRNPAAFVAAYPHVPASRVYGPYDGKLSNGGEAVVLVDAGAEMHDIVHYRDGGAWDFLADGYGASLERRCLDAPSDRATSWRARVPAVSAPLHGGSPGAHGELMTCQWSPWRAPSVLISEIMYHPLLDEGHEHELVEIYNVAREPVSLTGWQLTGGIQYTFPPGSVIAGQGYLVIAQNRQQLAALAAYGLSVETLHGDYRGSLGNGGDRVALVDARGEVSDAVHYDDEAPWPIAADALGAGASWLPPELLPLSKHRHLGRSLERVSYGAPSWDAANWDASPLDGATPGRPNATARSVPRPIVLELRVSPAAGTGGRIHERDEVRIEATFSSHGAVGKVALQTFVDDVERQDEAIHTWPMFDDGIGGADPSADDRRYSARLPAQVANAVVRYRVVAERDDKLAVVSPRESDPTSWHAYFVRPVGDSASSYHVFISAESWTEMGRNIEKGRVNGCDENPSWNAKVPAILVHDGRVFDVRARYQGSRWGRAKGPALAPDAAWRGARPRSALSWRFSFPRHHSLDGRRVLVLNKLRSDCLGLRSAVGFRLFREAGLPAPETRFARLHVNGVYYRSMLDIERPGAPMMRRFHSSEDPDTQEGAEAVGDLFKSVGCNCDEGPYGWGDARLLSAHCEYSAMDRYRATYSRKTNERRDHSELVDMLRQLHVARGQGNGSLRRFFETHFDVELMLNYVALMNWTVPFDDMFQNYFLYRRPSDDKWLLAPWDLDKNFGYREGAEASLYIGEQNDPDNQEDRWNYLKDAFIKSHRRQLDERILELNNTLLRPEAMDTLIDEVLSARRQSGADAAPAELVCRSQDDEASFRTFVRRRYELVNQRQRRAGGAR